MLACLQLQPSFDKSEIFSITGCTILLFGAIVQGNKTIEKIAYMEIPSFLDAAQLRQKKSNGMLGEEWAIDSTLEAMIELAASV